MTKKLFSFGLCSCCPIDGVRESRIHLNGIAFEKRGLDQTTGPKPVVGTQRETNHLQSKTRNYICAAYESDESTERIMIRKRSLQK